MPISSLSLCGVLASFAGVALSHNIQMGAHSRECFHEQLHKDDKMTVTFQVGDREFGGAGNLEIDFWVGYPSPAFAPPKHPHTPWATKSSIWCYTYQYLHTLHTFQEANTVLPSQIQDPTGGHQFYERAVSSGDHSFEAKHDGKYVYCFSNEHWSASSKEVSFNVHGIVYVPESDVPSDPLEQEGLLPLSTTTPYTDAAEAGQEGKRTRKMGVYDLDDGLLITGAHSEIPLQPPFSGQRRAVVHRGQRTHAQEHGRKHECQSEVVEYFSIGSFGWGGHIPSLVVEKVL